MWAVGAGCAATKESPKEAPKKEAKGEEEGPLAGQTINVGKGQGEFRDPASKPPGQTLWDVEWESSEVEAGMAKDDTKAVLRTVRGWLYTDGKPTTRFEADGARVDQAAKLLILRGNVKVTADRKANPDAKITGTLTCDQIRYEAKDPKRKIIKARGNVTVVGEAGTIGPTPELWANESLTVVATPNMFDER